MIAITVADGTAEKELLNSLRQRSGETDKKVTASVTEILDNVKARGDEAVREYTMKFDGRCPEQMEVTRAQMEEAVAKADPRFVEALRNAMENIRETDYSKSIHSRKHQIHNKQIRRLYRHSGKGFFRIFKALYLIAKTSKRYPYQFPDTFVIFNYIYHLHGFTFDIVL